MNKVIGTFFVLLIGVTAYLAAAMSKLSEENAVLTKKLIEKEQDYAWLERELQTTKRQFDQLARTQTMKADKQVAPAAQNISVSGQAQQVNDAQLPKAPIKPKSPQQVLASERLTANGRRL
ncbi:hypothetical protein LP316_06175 [Thalassotalea sp. LPB0316]|uniref:hypothetical protein n=1 Tax=Thalassotalea sp. LPB0316 TaxID=2769490 RepID=UPI001866F1B4|nr:hypothetical protein [Thalassotalea sp. LPB0316]QOL26876.1 hypothetical protein LP316_06175 [Thalassotalea sp. LPB0316]